MLEEAILGELQAAILLGEAPVIERALLRCTCLAYMSGIQNIKLAILATAELCNIGDSLVALCLLLNVVNVFEFKVEPENIHIKVLIYSILK